MNIQEIKQRLIDGNHQYVQDKENILSDIVLRNSLTKGQYPFAIILSCADSRVVPEMIFDCNIGELFVVRVAGNILKIIPTNLVCRSFHKSDLYK